MKTSSICVGIRIKPTNDTAKIWKVGEDKKTVSREGEEKSLCYSHVFDGDSSSKEIYDQMVKPLIQNSLNGINSTVLAYGQTGSGKTYTMTGTEKNPGVIIYSVSELFSLIKESKNKCSVKFSYFEIYNEKFRDLLVDKAETSSRECYSDFDVDSADSVFEHIKEGNARRSVGATNMNDRSSRSHAVAKFNVNVTTENEEILKSSLFLVDLAGSECAADTGAKGDRQNEAKNINQSLLSLSKVICALVQKQTVSYNDSKLTKLLKDSLGGKAKTAIICTISGDTKQKNVSENTLRFASNAMKVKSMPKVNKIVSEKALIKQLQEEIVSLQGKIAVYEKEMTSSEAREVEISRSRIEEITKTLFLNEDKHSYRAGGRKSMIPRFKNNIMNDSSDDSDIDAECCKIAGEVLGKNHKGIIDMNDLENEHLKAQIEGKDEEIENLRKEIETLKAENEESNSKSSELSNQLKDSEAKINELNEEIEKNKGKDEEIQSLAAEKTGLDEKIVALNKEKDELVKANENLLNEKENSAQTNESLANEIEKLKKENECLIQEKETLTKANHDLKQAKEKADKDFKDQEEINIRYNRKIQEIMVDNLKLKTAVNVEKADLETQTEEIAVVEEEEEITERIDCRTCFSEENLVLKNGKPRSDELMYRYVSLFLSFIIAVVIVMI